MTNNEIIFTENAIKRHSRRLQKYLSEKGENYSLTQSQQIFSKILGFNSWHELKKELTSTTLKKQPKIKSFMDNLWENEADVFNYFDYLIALNNFYHIDLIENRSEKGLTSFQVMLFLKTIFTVKELDEFKNENKNSNFITKTITYKKNKFKISVRTVPIFPIGTEHLIRILKINLNIKKLQNLVPTELSSKLLSFDKGLVLIGEYHSTSQAELLKSVKNEIKEKNIYSIFEDDSNSNSSYNGIELNNDCKINIIDCIRNGKTISNIFNHLSQHNSLCYSSIHSSSIAYSLFIILTFDDNIIENTKYINQLNMVVHCHPISESNPLYSYFIMTPEIKNEIINIIKNEKMERYNDVFPLLKDIVTKHININGKTLQVSAFEAYENKIITKEDLFKTIHLY